MSRIALAFAAALLGVAPLVQAGAEPLSVRENFRIGSGGSVLCTAQSLGNDKGLSTMFDRGYSVVCRDAAAPIGLIYALKTGAGDPADRLKALRVDRANCQNATPGQIEGLGAVEMIECTLKDADVTYRVYQYRKGNIALFRRRAGGLRQRAAARPAQRRRRQADPGRTVDCDHRRRRRRRVRARPGRHARRGARACRSLSAKQCRQLCGIRGVLRHGQQGRRGAHGQGGRPGQRSAPEIEPRPLRRSRRLVQPRRGAGRCRAARRTAAAQLSRDALAQPGQPEGCAGRARQALARGRPDRRRKDQ